MMFGKILIIIMIAFGLSKTVHASEQNLDRCAFTINFERGEPSLYWLQAGKALAQGRLVTLSNIYSEGEVITQKGIDLHNVACIYDVKLQSYISAESHGRILHEMTIPTFYDDEVCDGKIKKSYKENAQVTISMKDIWAGNTIHYARDFALIVDNLKIDDKWLCRK